ncbi:MAG: glutaredoxin [Richelia sp. RM2_1_2]|nr:glutaredoxin [Richelia sp. RM2_1_2]
MNVKIYSKDQCPYCVKAKQWFENYNIDYTEVKVTFAVKDVFLLETNGARTVPQILIDDELIGGYEDGLLAKEGYVKNLLGIK